MCNAARFNQRDPAGAVESEGDRYDRLQGIALGTARRRNVCLAARNPAGVVEDALHRLSRNTATVVCDDDFAALGRYLDTDLRCGLGFFSYVERVVDKFLEDDKRPILPGVAGLRGQLFLAAELGQPRNLKRYPLKGRGGPSARLSHVIAAAARAEAGPGGAPEKPLPPPVMRHRTLPFPCCTSLERVIEVDT